MTRRSPLTMLFVIHHRSDQSAGSHARRSHAPDRSRRPHVLRRSVVCSFHSLAAIFLIKSFPYNALHLSRSRTANEASIGVRVVEKATGLEQEPAGIQTDPNSVLADRPLTGRGGDDLAGLRNMREFGRGIELAVVDPAVAVPGDLAALRRPVRHRPRD